MPAQQNIVSIATTGKLIPTHLERYQLMKAYFAKAPDSAESLSKIMSENGINPTEMQKCLDDKNNNGMLRNAAQAGQDLNKNIAVFYVINNYFVHGAEQKVFVEDLIRYLGQVK